jgi:nucleoid DNA-binding protein
MTKTALVKLLAKQIGVTVKQSEALVDLLAETAIKEAKSNGIFAIPGIGRMVTIERKLRLGRSPHTPGIEKRTKTVVKFRLSKAVQEAIVSSG